jgi:hypothetical protein
MSGNPRLLIKSCNFITRKKDEPNTFNQRFGFVDNQRFGFVDNQRFGFVDNQIMHANYRLSTKCV